MGDNLGRFRKKYDSARPLCSCHLLGSAGETSLNSVNITCVKRPVLQRWFLQKEVLVRNRRVVTNDKREML